MKTQPSTKAAPTPPTTTGRDFVLRTIADAAARLPRFFPLDAFVASNPLHGFESIPFETAVRHAQQAFGGRGHRPLRVYREALAEGRLDEALVDAVLGAFGPYGRMSLAGHTFGGRALIGHLARHGLEAPADEALLRAAASVVEAAQAPAASPPYGKDFDPARETLPAWLDRHLGTDLAIAASERTIALLQSLLLGNGTTLRVAGSEAGLYAAFRAEFAADPLLRRLLKDEGAELEDVAPTSAIRAIITALYALKIPAEFRGRYIERQLYSLKGWSAFVRWYESQGSDHGRVPASLIDLAAIRLTLERTLCHDLTRRLGLESDTGALLAYAAREGSAPVPARTEAGTIAAVASWLGIHATDLGTRATSEEAHAILEFVAQYDDVWLALRFLEASEARYRRELNEALLEGAAGAARLTALPVRPEAQFVFCIDVRSEPFRRALERQGRVETFGYAGFFGLPVAYQRLDGSTSARCPALIQPGHAMHEAFATHLSDEDRRRIRREREHAQLRSEAVAKARQHPLAGLGLVDGFGILSLVPLIKDAFGWRRSGTAVEEGFAPALDHEGCHGLAALSFDEQVAIARNLFELTGLSAPFARLIVLTGHGSTTENNPFASALDCGACGGHEGAPNARALARILNDREIREALATHGIELPEDTVFVPAQHDTTTDDVTLFDLSLIPDKATASIPAIERMLDGAGRENRQRRAPRLRVADPEADLRRRAVDSAAVRPEWGLAGNAAFVVAPRSITRALNLSGRAFLHSYDWRNDPDGAALTTIMTAPMVVTQWINAQYYFSTVDNAAWGSGSKVTQNVVGCAVMQGELSDLKLGLPYQSVFDERGRAAHEPLRLLVVVHAPANRVAQVLAEHPEVKQLFDNRWLALEVLDPEARALLAYHSGEGFETVALYEGRDAITAAS